MIQLMGTLTIRKLDDDVKARLRLRAASHGRSMEEEARTILGEALAEQPRNQGQQLVDAFREAFGPLGGVDLELPSRQSMREPPSFD